MSKKSTFTTITPLPAGMPRAAAVAFLQDHLSMIDLNPLVTDRQRIPPPPHALADELPCTWYLVTDRIAYLPGGLASGSVSYSCAFLDLPGVGLQTHCYAPMGVDLRTRWSVGGSEPGEEREVAELGVGAPATGLYLREDTQLKCSLVMAGFVKKTLKDSHKRLVEKLAQRGAREVREREDRERVLGTATPGSTVSSREKSGGLNYARYSGDASSMRGNYGRETHGQAAAGQYQQQHRHQRQSSYTGPVEYPRNASQHQHHQQQGHQQQGYVCPVSSAAGATPNASSDGATPYGMQKYGGGGYAQQHNQQQQQQQQQQYHEVAGDGWGQRAELE